MSLDIPTTPTLQIKADLEEFRVIIASKVTALFDIQVQGATNFCCRSDSLRDF